MPSKTVLVTGGSGYIGAHVIVAALNAGYSVRTTARSTKRGESIREKLRNGGISDDMAKGVEIAQVDLLSDNGWEEAAKGCDYILHVASPFPPGKPKHPDDLIKPAREGTLRALRAAKMAGTVKRVVITSSAAAVMMGGEAKGPENPYNEKDWTNPEDPKVDAYSKSKTLAEKAAWDWLKNDGKGTGIELATVNPVLVLGPVLGDEANTSLELPAKMLNGELPGIPDINFGVVDVRDVADLHIMAMKTPKAAGQRYIAISDEPVVSAKEIAGYLKEGLPASESRKVPRRSLPNFLLKLAAWFDQSVKLIVPELGVVRAASNAKAKSDLGWAPRSAKTATLDSVESLKRAGRVKV